jgi:hypothetical protein
MMKGYSTNDMWMSVVYNFVKEITWWQIIKNGECNW